MTKRARNLRPAARATGAELLRRWPSAIKATRAAIRTTASVVNAMPSSEVKALAAGSAGLGAGLYLGGAPRLVAAAGMAPAIVFGAAALARSAAPIAPDPGESGADVSDDESRFDDDGGPVDASLVR